MNKDRITRLQEAEKEIAELRRGKATAENLLAVVVSTIGSVELDMSKRFTVDFDKIEVAWDNDITDKVTVTYREDLTT